ncbi:MAG: hypothetical protein Q8M15_10990 [Bacteroidota bacterium]|nr:hypothetical protein [Bacteroidota bacterium]
MQLWMWLLCKRQNTHSILSINPDRFDPVALKIFIQNKKPIVTLFAVDKYKQEQFTYPSNKLPVKK